MLQTLNLSWNHIRRKGAVVLANGLKVVNSSQRFVYIHVNPAAGEPDAEGTESLSQRTGGRGNNCSG